MDKDIFIDIETFSSIDIMKAGAYKYVESPDFEILLLSYAFGRHGKTVLVDLMLGDEYPEEFLAAMKDPTVRKHAHNATFERISFRRVGIDVPIDQWFCTAVKAAYCGLPFSLDAVSKRLDIKNKKLESGKALIKYFSCPCRPTKANGQRTRNYPEHDMEKWTQYGEYNIVDVEAEREIYYILEPYEIPQFERDMYILDQTINDRGIGVNIQFAANAVEIESEYTGQVIWEIRDKYGIENPGSVKQLKDWIFALTGFKITSLSKETMPTLLEHFKDNHAVMDVLQGKLKLSKTSVKKYTSMLMCAGNDHRVRGLFQHYGANRTGRWAGRLVQLQNLPQTHLKDLDAARLHVFNKDTEALEMVYDDVATVLSDLIRTSFEAKKDHIYRVADFSAIEARVTSWLAGEEWRLEVFRGHGKIYEAAASKMFNVPIELVTKDSDYRAKAKNAELALGYQGSLGAMKRMGGDKMGMSDAEMMSTVHKWRKANPKTVAMWDEFNECALSSVMYKTEVISTVKGIIFRTDDNCMTIELPSGRSLFYRNPAIKTNRFNSKCVTYDGIIQETKQWGSIETYGGKLTENIVQAISRDILGYSMLQLEANNFPIVMHVHDEAIAETPITDKQTSLPRMCDIMGEDIPWAEGLPLRAEGFNSPFYKKD